MIFLFLPKLYIMSCPKMPHCEYCNSTDNLVNTEGLVTLMVKEYNDVLEKIKELDNPKCYVIKNKLFASDKTKTILLSSNPGVAFSWAEKKDEFVKVTRNMFA